MDPLTLNLAPVKLQHAGLMLRVGGVEININAYNHGSNCPAPAAQPAASPKSDGAMVFGDASPASFPGAEGAGPQVSGKLGDGQLLSRFLEAAPKIIALLAQFGILKAKS